MEKRFDVAIIGAGISGIAAAHHLKKQCPDKTFIVIEKKPTFGGTWHTFNYPGIRSDSDLYTFGYRFKRWTGEPVAEGHEILRYMSEVVGERGCLVRISLWALRPRSTCLMFPDLAMSSEQ